MKRLPEKRRPHAVACRSEHEQPTQSESLSAAHRALEDARIHIESASERAGRVAETERLLCLVKAYFLDRALGARIPPLHPPLKKPGGAR